MTDSLQRKSDIPATCPTTVDAAAIIRGMKIRGGFETDTALATFLGRTQSAVSQWRRTNSVPESAIVRFETRIAKAAA